MSNPAAEINNVSPGRMPTVFANTTAANAAGVLIKTNGLVPKAVYVKTGTVTITRLDDVSVTLPDYAVPWKWEVQFKRITAGTATDLVVIY